MTQEDGRRTGRDFQLLLGPTDTKMAKILSGAMDLLRNHPGILDRIRADQDAAALKAKAERMADAEWLANRHGDLEIGESGSGVAAKAEDLVLGEGRPRMPAVVVYLFLILRGAYGGSVCSESNWDRFVDSMTLWSFLGQYVKRLPGRTTVLENLNVVSSTTREYIYGCQLSSILGEDLDDFLDSTIDSTAVAANSAWPTETHLLVGMLNEAYRLGQRLDRFGLSNFRQWRVPQWLTQLDRLEFELNMCSKRKNRLFRKTAKAFAKKVRQIADCLAREVEFAESAVESAELMPSTRRHLEELWKRLGNDLCDSYTLVDFFEERVFGAGPVEREEHEKIYSLSDRSAAFIAKGGRDTIFGYRVQFARSAKGFITALDVPEGNVPDSVQLLPMVRKHQSNTGVVPTSVSVDDGYASKDGRKTVLRLGVEVLSISGSKGRKLTPEDLWDSELYRQARNDRSAVESLMYLVKYTFGARRCCRRGIDNVRNEMLEIVIAHNFWRMAYEREQQDRQRLLKQEAG